MQVVFGYICGLAVALLIVAANHKPVTQFTIEQAQAVCMENKGLKEIDNGEFRCNNGATFEQEKAR